MNSVHRLSLALAVVLPAGCGPSDKQIVDAIQRNPTAIRTALENDPSILYAAIKKDPNKFIEIVTEVTKQARAADKIKAFDEQLKAPKEPALTASRVFAGNADAPVTIIEYTDMQCPYCSRGQQIMEQLLAQYPGKLRVISKHFPLPIHPFAPEAAHMFEAIGSQDRGQALAFKAALFVRQREFGKRGPLLIRDLAKDAKIDLARAQKDAKSEAVQRLVAEDAKEAQQFGFSGTPGYLINGVALFGARPVDDFKVLIDRLLADR